MILTNRVVGSDEALAWGLVEKVVPGESLLDGVTTVATVAALEEALETAFG